MSGIGDIVFDAGNREIRLKPLTVRQMIGIQNILGNRMAREIIEDGKEAGIEGDKLVEMSRDARRGAMLTSSLIRWCFQTDGAVEIISESCRIGGIEPDFIDLIDADELSDIACQLIGFVWDDQQSKWVGRSRKPSGRATA